MPRTFKSIPAVLPESETIDTAQICKDFESGLIDLICVLGPTASGKTRYAVRLAEKIQANTGRQVEILSADSRQVYRGMDIGTGKDLAEYGSVPHHLIDIADPGDGYNVFRFQQDFLNAYHDILRRGAVPILCGGTGLYINAVTSGYDFTESKPLSQAQATPGREGFPENTYFIGTLVDRDTRNARIDRRLDERLAEGMVEEIRRLLDGGVSGDVLISYGLEYKFVTRYILGEITYDEMKRLLATAIHQFAKRQMTWFRGMERAGNTIHWTQV